MKIEIAKTQEISVLSVVLGDDGKAIGVILPLAQIDLNVRAIFIDFRRGACISARLLQYWADVKDMEEAEHRAAECWFETGKLPAQVVDAGVDFTGGGEETAFYSDIVRKHGYEVVAA